jgi:hypothetical protein
MINVNDGILLSELLVNMRSQLILGSILAAATTTSAHGWIKTWTIGGKDYNGYNVSELDSEPDQNTIAWKARNHYGLFVQGIFHINSTNMNCNINATTSKISPPSIAAGETLAVTWMAEPTSWPNQAWPANHKGPIMTYLAACNGDCTRVDQTQLKWFKIAEQGQISYGSPNQAGVWATDKLIQAGGAWSIKIPLSIKAGGYVIRNELLALHDLNNPQFYPQCANLQITGGGSASPDGVEGTALYSLDEPGVLYSIYQDDKKPVYKIPGPALCKSHSYVGLTFAKPETVTG